MPLPPKKPSPIVNAGHPVLRAAAEGVPEAMFGTRELDKLVERMVAAMRGAPGVGLAAPQLGVGLRVLVFEDREELMAKLTPDERKARERVAHPLTVLANPTIRVASETRATFFEGCLSVPGYMALVERALDVEVTARDVKGAPVTLRAHGWPARILQHEIDHLEGTLYVDRMHARTFTTNAECVARWLPQAPGDVAEALDARRRPTPR